MNVLISFERDFIDRPLRWLIEKGLFTLAVHISLVLMYAVAMFIYDDGLTLAGKIASFVFFVIVAVIAELVYRPTRVGKWSDISMCTPVGLVYFTLAYVFIAAIAGGCSGFFYWGCMFEIMHFYVLSDGVNE